MWQLGDRADWFRSFAERHRFERAKARGVPTRAGRVLPGPRLHGEVTTHVHTAAPALFPLQFRPAIAARTRLRRPWGSEIAVIATARLRLRALEETDILAFRTIATEHPATEGTIGLPHTLGSGTADQWFEYRNAASDRPRAMHWAVCELGDDRLVGYTGLHHIELKSRQAELSFWIDGRARQSYALEASQAALAFAFVTLQLHRVRAFHRAHHLCAGSTLSRLGMRPEGMLPHHALRWARPEHVIASVILRSDWLQSL